eukprot:comp23492_c0_seq1/m.39325 comp23492_c0_seq1/g.39325  ORF comp23492_c0_seq1/g.39325 comp23492_c0_seq1/m.39325 type:complete len:840 (-) comp23492_c0_seq1:149-2668(-)
MSEAASIAAMVVMVCIMLGIPAALYLVALLYNPPATQIEKSENGNYHSQVDVTGTGSGEKPDDMQPAVLSFHNIVYSVPVKKIQKADGTYGPSRKIILRNVSGVFRPGTLTAIMGPSGCGKSTLLNVLADRQPSGPVVTGDIKVNGQERGIFYKRVAAYVMQSDALFPCLTVREHLTYTAQLRVPPTVSPVQKAQRVEQVLAMVDLQPVADRKIGNEWIRGLSGGQKRRVTVATELITMPSILFLDEPTTGLDAYSSLRLVQTLDALRKSGRTIICTIHQPRPDIFRLFTHLFLMKAGEIGYFGPISEVPNYFASIGAPLPSGVNPADFIVDLTYPRDAEAAPAVAESEARRSIIRKLSRHITGGGGPEVPQPPQQLVEKEPEIEQMLVERFAESKIKMLLLKEVTGIHSGTIKDLPAPIEFGGVAGAANADGRFATTKVAQVTVLIRRAWTNMLRSPSTAFAYVIALVQFLFYGLLFLGVRTEGPTPTETLTIQQSFFFQVMNTVCLLEVDVIAMAFLERTMFYREHASGGYSVLSYHMAWLLRLFFFSIIKGLAFSALVYFFPGLPTGVGQFFVFALILMTLSTIGSSLALLLVSAIPDVEGAGAIHSTIIGMFATFAGYFLSPSAIPVFIIWIYYMSFYKYSLEGLMENAWEGDTINLSSLGVNQTVPVIGGLFDVDSTLNQYTNIIVLLFYPFIFHAVALGASAGYTHQEEFVRGFMRVITCGVRGKGDDTGIPEEHQRVSAAGEEHGNSLAVLTEAAQESSLPRYGPPPPSATEISSPKAPHAPKPSTPKPETPRQERGNFDEQALQTPGDPQSEGMDDGEAIVMSAIPTDGEE